MSFINFFLGSEKYKRITKISKNNKTKTNTKIIKSNTLIWFALNEGIEFRFKFFGTNLH